MVNPLRCAVALLAVPLLAQAGCKLKVTGGPLPVPNPLFNFTVEDGGRGLGTGVYGMGIDPAGDIHVVGVTGCDNCIESDCSICRGSTLDGVAVPAPGAYYFLTTYDAGGKRKATVLVAQDKLGFEYDFEPSGVVFDRAGDLYMAGSSATLATGTSAGVTTYHYRLIKIGANGAKTWSVIDGSLTNLNLLGSLTDRAVPAGVAADALGNLYITGRDISGYFFLSKYDSAGAKSWAFIEKHPNAPSNFDASSYDIATGPSGFPGTVVITASQGVAVAADSLGNAYIAGVASAFRIPDTNTEPARQLPDCAFLAKFDPTGTRSWMIVDYAPNSFVDVLGSQGSAARATVVATSSSGDVYIAGTVDNRAAPRFDGLPVRGVRSYFVSKYTSTGARTWTALNGSTGSIAVNAIAVDGAGNAFIMASGDLLDGTGGSDFVVGYDRDGTKTWVRAHTFYGVKNPAPPNYLLGASVAADTRGHVYEVGNATGSVDGQTYHTDPSDAAVFRLHGGDYYLSQMNVSGP